METTAKILTSHKQALLSASEQALTHWEKIQAEIASVDKALAAIGADADTDDSETEAETLQAAISAPLARLTIKQLVIKALMEVFTNGATANQMLEQFAIWGRPDIVRTSLSPQLSRLKDDEKIERDGLVWTLKPGTTAYLLS